MHRIESSMIVILSSSTDSPSLRHHSLDNLDDLRSRPGASRSS